MTIRFYTLIGDPRLVNKDVAGVLSPANIWTGDSTYQATGTLRDACSILDPVIQVAMPDDKITSFNYIEILDFPVRRNSRFYFVRDVKVLRSGLVEIYAHEDVLYSWKGPLLATSGYVKRSESMYNRLLPDDKRVFAADDVLSLITNQSAPQDLDPSYEGTPSAPATRKYVVTLAASTINNNGATPPASTTWRVNPPYTAVSGGVGMRSYALEKNDLKAFYDEFLALTDNQILSRLYGVGTEGIIAIKSLPFGVPSSLFNTLGSPHHMTIMTHQMTTTAEMLYDNPIKVIDFGTYAYSQQPTDFTEFEPYTTANMYLPYYGVVTIPMVYMTSGGVDVVYRIDCRTGDTIITIQAHGTGAYVKTLTCNVAEDVPITRTNNVELARNQMQNALNTISGGVALAAGHPAAGIMAIAGTMASSATQHLTMTGSLNNPNMLRMLRYTPYVLISRKKDVTGALYGQFYGYPVEETVTLGNLSGFTQVSEIFQNQNTGLFGLTASEWDELKAILREGVII